MRAAGWVLCALALAPAGCGVLRAGPRCDADDVVLATSGAATLTCADAARARYYVEALAARTVPGPDRANLETWLIGRFDADPAGTETALGAADAVLTSLLELRDLPAAEARSTAAFEALTGAGPLGDDPALLGVLKRAIGPWSTSTGDRLVLTEMDVEGWIKYASLCREAQGAGALRLSVSDRQVVYRLVVEAFDAADRSGKIALTGIGPFWPAIKTAWAEATYEEQQAWILAAPLPPPMTATSLGYTETLLSGPLPTHVVVLHEQLGPLATGVNE